MNSRNYQEKLLHNWEEIFRQGLLTFWVFVAIYDRHLNVGEIQKSVANLTKNTYTAADQTLYRLLRKQYELETVEYIEEANKDGPNRKLYTLSPLGKQLLQAFIERNITLFNQPIIRKLGRKG